MFERADFERIGDVLGGLKGRFIMSLNDLPETRSLFADFAQEIVPVTYTVGGGGKFAKRTELVISRP